MMYKTRNVQYVYMIYDTNRECYVKSPNGPIVYVSKYFAEMAARNAFHLEVHTFTLERA